MTNVKWLDAQLRTGDWRPITIKKSFPHRALTLTDNSVSGQAASNAEIVATHLTTRQRQEAEPSQGLNTATIYSNPPTISEVTISIDEVKFVVKQATAAKRAGKDNIPNDFWKHLEGRGLDAVVSLFQLYWGLPKW